MEKRFPFKKEERKIYQFWERGNYFKPNPKGKGVFSIIMPPPNANAPLHLGHAVFVTLEDIMIRYQRMRGKNVLWLPGTDHAGFETQVVFEKELEKQGKTRFQFPPQVLYKMIWDFTKKNKKITEKQLRRLGASCDWTREKFTLEPDIIKLVYKTFKKLYEDNLIYRGKRIVNWCPYHQTSLSDLEVIYQERKTKLVYIRYPLLDKKESFITIATTRPETMLGDTAVAINPKDKRYQYLVGKKVLLPITNRIIPIISDNLVDPNFGTGIVKITPSHDPLDFEIGERHKLSSLEVIDREGKMTKEAGKDYFGLKTKEAREKVIADLKKLNLIEKEEDYSHRLPICYKCKKEIEPLVSDQWFIKMEPLVKKAIEAVKRGEVKFITKHFEKIFFHWMKNIKDWNISRQIVWGIKIPVFYCQDKNCKEIIITEGEKLLKCPKCKGKIIPEKDTFDTWFSSGQWPFLTLLNLGKRKKIKRKKSFIFDFITSDFETFYSTSVMETGYDILFFWVARMIILGLYTTGKVPFRYVYLHGIVRDKERQKMSKSKGNVIDPLGVIDLYGTDALRMALVFGTSAGKDVIISEDKIRAMQKFVTKVWNASRFILQNFDKNFKPERFSLNKNDKKILKELNQSIREITKNIENFQFHEALQKIYHLFWHKFCDKWLEEKKKILYSEEVSISEKKKAQQMLYILLLTQLKLLHPFIPFVTESIYQKLPFKKKKALIIEEWPV